MGGGHDLMDPISHHGANGISGTEARNRAYLRTIMDDCGFDSYHCEWWHYSLRDEPYPNTYFDFPIRAIGALARGLNWISWAADKHHPTGPNDSLLPLSRFPLSQSAELFGTRSAPERVTAA